MSATSTATLGTTVKETIQLDDFNANGDGRSKRGESCSMPCGRSVVCPQADLETVIREVLCLVGEDPNREGLQKTPARYAKALLHLTKGYSERVEDVVNDAIFTVENNDLVLVRDIAIASTCEHHLMPFFGKMHIGYIPNGRVLGLSKLARIAQVFSCRLQIQERLTSQVAAAIEELVSPVGVAVISECTHMCMVARGVEKTGTSTLSQSMTGLLKDDPKTQEQFYNLLRSSQN